MCSESSTDSELPSRAMPNTDSELPIRMKERSETVDPSSKHHVKSILGSMPEADLSTLCQLIFDKGAKYAERNGMPGNAYCCECCRRRADSCGCARADLPM